MVNLLSDFNRKAAEVVNHLQEFWARKMAERGETSFRTYRAIWYTGAGMFGMVLLLDLYNWTGDRESISDIMNHDSMFLWMISLALTERRVKSPYHSVATVLNTVSMILLVLYFIVKP